MGDVLERGEELMTVRHDICWLDRDGDEFRAEVDHLGTDAEPIFQIQSNGEDHLQAYCTKPQAIRLIDWLIGVFDLTPPMPPEQWNAFLKEVKDS